MKMTPSEKAVAGLGVVVFSALAVAVVVRLNEAPAPAITSSTPEAPAPAVYAAEPAQSWGYRKGYDLGFGMGQSGAGKPTEDAMRSMVAMHAPGDDLQFRFGYRAGLEAGRAERLRSK